MFSMKKNEIFLLEELVKKNFSAKYKDSVLGIFWSVLKPLCTMIILTIIFSTLFHGRIENYPVYLLSGRSIFTFFSATTAATLIAIKSNKNILQKNSVPKYIFILAAVISEIINLFISIAILFLVMIATKNPFYFNIIPLSIIPIISIFIMNIGVGLMLSIFCVYYADVQHLWSVITMMLVYSSAIFYPMDIIPEPYHSYLLLNPIFWIIDQFRDLIMYGTIPDLLNILNSLLLSTIILIIGIIVFKKYENKVIMKL